MEYIVIFLICTISGFLTGLLSVGGGIVIVPLFLAILPLFGITFSLAEVIGVSATCVFINSSVTAFYRRKEKFLPLKTILPLIISIIIGTVSGAYLADFAPKYIILGIYICVSLMSLYLINGEIYCDLKQKKLSFVLYLIFAFIGAISSSIGIGGAVLFVTALKCFMGKDTKELLPTITILVLCHAFFAFSSKFILGHITLYIIPIAFVASLLGSKIGVKVSRKLSAKTLNILLSVVLVLGLIKIIQELFA
ncbi:MAG: sulfite exporter TauE/SafE family protein [Candidatus Gastranaerophilales bacterium]|nr:sulfite exporter TauE/SafE family protein [Candidatus Gastranaerophilales bacterium]